MSEVTARSALIAGMMAINQPHYIKFPNSVYFVKASGAYTSTTPTSEPWLRLTTLNITDEPVALGNQGYNMREGLAQIDVFTPSSAASGDLIASQLADKVRSVFKTGANLSGVRITSAATKNAAADDSGWFRRIVEVAFYYHVKRSA